MKRLARVSCSRAAAIITVARGGHELPIYPSFYPHEIEIKTLAPEHAAERAARWQDPGLYRPRLGLPARRRPTSARSNRSAHSSSCASIRARARAGRGSACAVVEAVVRALAAAERFHSASLPGHAVPRRLPSSRRSRGGRARRASRRRRAPAGDLKIKARGSLAQSHPDWSAREADWDAEVIEIDAAELVASPMLFGERLARAAVGANRLVPRRASPGRCGRRTCRTERASRVRPCGVSRPAISAALVERINLERDLVTALTGGCRKIVAGYTVKREYVNVEYLGRDREHRLRFASPACIRRCSSAR